MKFQASKTMHQGKNKNWLRQAHEIGALVSASIISSLKI
jgi:hypothetical protein